MAKLREYIGLLANLAPTASGTGGSALFSECGTYRYLLTRRLVHARTRNQTCLFIMLNPSTADADNNDPTIRRCIGFAEGWGMEELRVVNLFAFRATDPRQLTLANDPVGPDNDAVITDELEKADLVVAAWGNSGVLGGRADDVRDMAVRFGATLLQLGTNKTGEPQHPLYARAETVLSPLTGFLYA